MTAAGTSAPIAIAENAKPANQDGNSAWNSAGTTSLRRVHLDVGGMGHIAEQRDQAEQQRIGRSRIAFLRMVSADFEAKMPVRVCGYMKAASAEPSASVA